MKVALVGRTNVGKSSLFNRIAKKKQALVFDEPGITRDLLKACTAWWGYDFEVIDSGGLPLQDQKDELSVKIKEHIDKSFQEADIFIVVMDGKHGLHSEDLRVINEVRKTNKPFICFVNKVDHPKNTETLIADFYQAIPDFLSGSAEQNYGVDELIEFIISEIQKNQTQKTQSPSSDITSLFVIGKANSGKSLLCNQILNKERMIVSSQAGTTLDTVTEFFSKDDAEYSISDNPGSQRGNKEERERLSYAKSLSELKTSHLILLVMDGTKGPSRQDAKLIQLCLEKKKPCILVVNKMDIVKKWDTEDKKQQRDQIKRTFHFYEDLPLVFMSAKTGFNKEKLFEAISSLKQKISFKISTSELNKFFTDVIKKAPSPVYGTSDVKFYYITQTHKTPPEFIAFANYPKGVTPSYRRFVINQMKSHWKLQGIPIHLHILPKR